MICTNCGKEVPDTAKVCGYCGHRLRAAPPQPSALPAAPSKRGLPGWTIALMAGLALCIVAVVVVALLPGRGPREAAPYLTPMAQLPLIQVTIPPLPTATKMPIAAPTVALPTLAPTTEPTEESGPPMPVLEAATFLLRSEDQWETVAAQQPVIAEWRWGVCDPALLPENNDATTFKVTVDGGLVGSGSMAEYRSEVREEDTVTGEHAWFQYYSYPMGAFESGSSHWLELEYGFTREVTDGCDVDGDGNPEWYGPDSEFPTRRLEITVQ